jgi:hypothetical protein
MELIVQMLKVTVLNIPLTLIERARAGVESLAAAVVFVRAQIGGNTRTNASLSTPGAVNNKFRELKLIRKNLFIVFALAGFLALSADARAQLKPDTAKPQTPGQDYSRADNDKAVLGVGKLGWANIFPGETEVGYIQLAPDANEGCPHGRFLVNIGNPAGRKNWEEAVAAKAGGKLVDIKSNQKGHKRGTEPCIVNNVKTK